MSMRKSRHQPLRAPFVVTVAATAAAAVATLPACGSVVTESPSDTGAGGSTGNASSGTGSSASVQGAGGATASATGAGGSQAECPVIAPVQGAPCASSGLVCDYTDECGQIFTVSCAAGSWEYADGPSTCNPPIPECPAAPPEDGSPCPMAGLACTYDRNHPCGSRVVAECGDDLAWDVWEDVPPCNPPPCPDELPAAGSPCDPVFGPFCYYEVDIGCGPQEASAVCAEDGWKVSLPICNPQPPHFCYGVATEAECKLVAGCRWLVPGCGEPPLPAAGCFPLGECQLDIDCPPDRACAEVVYNPCYKQVCEACGAGASLCVKK